VLTGEYPPAPGGVSDYTRLVACGLAAAGDMVEVWAPACGSKAPNDPGVQVHWLPSNFGPGALCELQQALRCQPGPRRLLVQYVPHAFGFKAMNVGLAHWLFRARHRECVWVMFHEVCFGRRRGQDLEAQRFEYVQRWMGAAGRPRRPEAIRVHSPLANDIAIAQSAVRTRGMAPRPQHGCYTTSTQKTETIFGIVPASSRRADPWAFWPRSRKP